MKARKASLAGRRPRRADLRRGYRKVGLERRARKIRLLLMDVDGVLTDGRLTYLETRPGVVEELKAFNSKDGIGLMLAREGGLQTGLISGRKSSGVAFRAELLGFQFVVQGTLKKLPAYESILAKGGFLDDEVAYVGDDLPDIPVLRRVGLPVAVADSAPEVLQVAALVTRSPGGYGAVREVVELILKSQGRWRSAIEKKGIA